MPWSSIGDGAYIRVGDQSSITQLLSRKRKAELDHDIIDLTSSARTAKKYSDSTSHEPKVYDDIELPNNGPDVTFRAVSKCRVSHSKIDGAGLGLITTTNIRPGDVIVIERPFLTVDYPPRPSQIERRYNRLSTIDRLLFHSFHSKSPGEVGSTIAEILANNVVPLGCAMGVEEEGVTDGEPTRSGMFRYICRINHSCVPNAQWIWREDEGRMVLKAVLPIASGQEITASYLDDHTELFASRQAFLSKNFGFTCRCEQCALRPSLQLASDKRLSRYRIIRDQYIGDENEDNWSVFGFRDCWNKIKQAIRILEREERWIEVPGCWESLFHVAVGWGERVEAKEAGAAWATELAKTNDHLMDSDILRIQRPEDEVEWCRFIGPDDVEVMPESDSSEYEDSQQPIRHSKRRQASRNSRNTRRSTRERRRAQSTASDPDEGMW